MSVVGTWFDEDGESKYDNSRHADLPWGYWLVSIGETPGEPPLQDEEGNVWKSVRDAFWTGRLGLSGAGSDHVTDCLEFILAFMATVDGRFVEREESAYSLFDGAYHFGVFFRTMLDREGLYEIANRRLTAEGRAVLLMLASTRDHEDADNGMGRDWIEATKGLARGDARRAAAEMVAEREQTASRMAHRFAIDRIDDKLTVKLIGLKITPTIPVRSTLWSISFADEYARDRFYAWLLERIDRWDDWSRMAADKGARALSEHLLHLSFCDRLADTG